MTDPVERRARLRLPVHWPLRIMPPNGGEEVLDSVTENLSSQGFYCWISRALAPGDCLRCVIEFPSRSAASARRLRLHCHAEVVRSERGPQPGMFGIACRIKEYSVEAVDELCLAGPSGSAAG
ncbi:MAG: PilZ domain-containing protein [Bryobacteraceae bacterium]